MFYERKIKYFSYMENGERVSGAGFAKLEVRDKLCFLTLQINNLGISNNYSKQVFLLDSERECQLCELQIKQGKGMVQFQLPCDNLCGGVTYGNLRAIRIPIAAGKEIYCEIQEQVKEKVPQIKSPQVKTPEVKQSQINTPEEEQVDLELIEESNLENVQMVPNVQMNEQVQQETIKASEKMVSPEKETSSRIQTKQYIEHELQENETKDREQKVPLQENKWKQLSVIYKHIAPFQDERDYLSIGPGDFVIFPEKYYKLVNNSFLLHGYYNYKHLILTKMIIRGETRYYMGVPGNFYEREKQVALMFGFESFECQEEPARAGDYGYYMMRVDL